MTDLQKECAKQLNLSVNYLGDLLKSETGRTAKDHINEFVVEKAKTKVRETVSTEGQISGELIDANQTAAHGLAWMATYAQSLHQMQAWAERLDAQGRFGEIEQLIHQIAFGEYLHQLAGGIPMNQGEVVRLQELGLGWDALSGFQCAEVQTLMASGNSQAARTRLVELMQEQAANITVGASGLDLPRPHMELLRRHDGMSEAERLDALRHNLNTLMLHDKCLHFPFPVSSTRTKPGQRFFWATNDCERMLSWGDTGSLVLPHHDTELQMLDDVIRALG